MTIDEALLLADELLAERVPMKGVFYAAVLLAEEVRRQHAQIEALRAKLDSIGGDV